MSSNFDEQLSESDCDILIPRRTGTGNTLSENTLWQKERLLNIALENLPKTVEKVMWLDSDLIFLNDDWVPETAELLDRFPVVQPFGWMTYLPADQGLKYAYEKLPALPLGQGVGGVYHSAGLGVSSFGEMAFRSNFLLGHPGFAWAARREVITASGFYDRSIIGGGDRIMLDTFTGQYGGMAKKLPSGMFDDIKAFGRKLTPLVGPGNISYTQGVVLHIWHGDRANRDYTRRYQILLSNRYDPVSDVRVNEAGVLVWNSDKLQLHNQVTEYFNNRKEGPKPNRTASDEIQIDDTDNAELAFGATKGRSRTVQSYVGYHCRRSEYRSSCKVAFKLWGEALRLTQLQLHQRQLRLEQAHMAEQMKAAKEAEQQNKLGKRRVKKPQARAA